MATIYLGLSAVWFIASLAWILWLWRVQPRVSIGIEIKPVDQVRRENPEWFDPLTGEWLDDDEPARGAN